MGINLFEKDIVGKAFLAPMAGVNCTSFRIQCASYGAAIVFTQMYKVRTIIDMNQHQDREITRRLDDYLNISESERKTAVQLVGNIDDDWEKAVRILSLFDRIRLIDINFGCPEEDLLSEKMGSYNLQEIKNVYSIVSRCVKASKKPISAKIRAGWEKDDSIEISKAIEKSGASMITVHARTVKQKYADKSELEIIKKVKENVGIPVCGNGDINLPGHAKAFFEKTKCDYVMIGRAAMKNPEIFSYINHMIEHGKNKEKIDRDTKDPIKLSLEFIELYEKHEKRKNANEVKDHIKWIFTETKHVNNIKEEIDDKKSIKEIKEFIVSLNKSKRG